MHIRLYHIKRAVAFGGIYFLWGGSYLAIRSVVSIVPPMFAAALRYCIGGAILLGISVLVRRKPFATLRQFANCCLLGLGMIVAGYALVFWASTQLQSWIVAVLVSTSSLWTYLGETWVLRRQRARAAVLIPLLAGLTSIPILSMDSVHGNEQHFIAAAAILFSSVAWSLGTLALRRLRLPTCPFQTGGMQLLCAGSILAAISWGLGNWSHLTLRGMVGNTKLMMGMAYLVLAGSVVTFGAYHWLMQRESPTLVATFAYVNPIVAMLLGIGLGHEHFSGAQLAGAAAIVGCVVQVWRTQLRSIKIPEKQTNSMAPATALSSTILATDPE